MSVADIFGAFFGDGADDLDQIGPRTDLLDGEDQIGPRTDLIEPKRRRGVNKATVPLRDFILGLTDRFDVMTVRQVYYQCEVAALVPKTEAAYRKAQRQVLALRREEKLAWSFIADGSRWQRKPSTWDSAQDFLDNVARSYRRDLLAPSPGQFPSRTLNSSASGCAGKSSSRIRAGRLRSIRSACSAPGSRSSTGPGSRRGSGRDSPRRSPLRCSGRSCPMAGVACSHLGLLALFQAGLQVKGLLRRPPSRSGPQQLGDEDYGYEALAPRRHLLLVLATDSGIGVVGTLFSAN